MYRDKRERKRVLNSAMGVAETLGSTFVQHTQLQNGWAGIRSVFLNFYHYNSSSSQIIWIIPVHLTCISLMHDGAVVNNVCRKCVVRVNGVNAWYRSTSYKQLDNKKAKTKCIKMRFVCIFTLLGFKGAKINKKTLFFSGYTPCHHCLSLCTPSCWCWYPCCWWAGSYGDCCCWWCISAISILTSGWWLSSGASLILAANSVPTPARVPQPTYENIYTLVFNQENKYASCLSHNAPDCFWSHVCLLLLYSPRVV